MAGDTADDELAAGLVDGGFGAEEAVRADDVADTVGLDLVSPGVCDREDLGLTRKTKAVAVVRLV